MSADSIKASVSCLATVASFSIEKASTCLSVVAALVAILAGLPVVVDRWRHKLPDFITRHFPIKPTP